MFYLALTLFAIGIIALAISGSVKVRETAPAELEPGDNPEMVITPPEVKPPQDILYLASSLDGFDLDNIQFTVSDKSFYLDFALDEREKLSENDISFKPDFFFEEGMTLPDLALKLDIPDLPLLVEKHRNAVSWDVRKSKSTFLANHQQFGVYEIIAEKDENLVTTHLEIILFNTDAFTHFVMKSVFRELQAKKDQICWATNSNLSLYNLFLTTLDTKMVIIDNFLPDAPKLIVAIEDNLHYPCFSKSLSDKDIAKEGGISPPKWLINILTETGIKALPEKPETKLYNLYFDRSQFTVGFCSSLACPVTARSLNTVLNKSLISSFSFMGVNLRASELHKLIEKMPLSLAELFCLETIGDRLGLDLHRYSNDYAAYLSIFDDSPPTVELPPLPFI